MAETPPSDNSSRMTVVVGMEKPSEESPGSPKSSAPSTTASTAAPTARPKRILPKHLIPHLQPGAEYSPWGDAAWELCGSEEDGTLSMASPDEEFNRNAEYWIKSNIPPTVAPDILELIRIIGFEDAPMPRRDPFPHHKWPLTNKERIEELEAILKDENWEWSFANIKAAIEYHQEFDQNTLCNEEQVYFQDGRRLGSDQLPTNNEFWVEVIPDPDSLFLILNSIRGV